MDYILTTLEEGISHAEYMKLYTSIYNYCTSTAQNQSTMPKNAVFVMRGAHFYDKLKAFLLFSNLVGPLEGSQGDSSDPDARFHWFACMING
jgi:hypothetical protein